MSNRLALCNTVLSGPRPVDLSTGFSILPGRPEAIEKSISSAAFLSACEGHNTRSQAVGSGPFINRYSVELEGGSEYLDVGNYSDYNFGSGGTDSAFSVSAWLNMTDATDFVVAGKDDGSGSNRQYTIRFVGGKMHFYLLGGGYIGRSVSTTATSDELSWIHVAFTYDGSKSETGIKIYRNGTRVDDTSYSGGSYAGMSATSASFTIGKQGTIYSRGLMDEVAVFNSEISSSDITSIYNEGTPNDISSLEPVSWWRMGDSNSGVGTTVTDVGSGGNDGTLENGAEFIDKTVLRKPEDATVVYNYPETSDIPIKPIDLSVSLSDEGAGLIDPTDLQVLLYPPNLRISIQDTEENILARTGDTAGTMAFGTDTNNLYIANTEGFDSWSSIEDN